MYTPAPEQMCGLWPRNRGLCSLDEGMIGDPESLQVMRRKGTGLVHQSHALAGKSF